MITSENQTATGVIPANEAGPNGPLRETQGGAISNRTNASLLVALARAQDDALVEAHNRLLRLWLRPPAMRSGADPGAGSPTLGLGSWSAHRISARCQRPPSPGGGHGG
jgi:hypothetical protein